MTGQVVRTPAAPRRARSGHSPRNCQHLGTVDEALPTERHQIGLRLAPPVSAAVHSRARRMSKILWHSSSTAQYTMPAVIGADLARGDAPPSPRRATSSPFGDLPAGDECLPAAEPAVCDDIGVAAAFADCRRLHERGQGSRGVAAAELDEAGGHEQQTLRDALDTGFFDEALSTREPPAALRHVSPHHHEEARARTRRWRRREACPIEGSARAHGPRHRSIRRPCRSGALTTASRSRSTASSGAS